MSHSRTRNKTEAAPGLSPNLQMPSPGTRRLAEARPRAAGSPVCPQLPRAQGTSRASARSCASSSPCMDVLRTATIVLVVLLWPFSLSLPLTFPRERERERERERGAGQSRTHHSRRGNTIILASWTRGILVLYLKQSMSPGCIWVLFSVVLQVFSEVCPNYPESLRHSPSLCENGCNFFLPLKSTGVVKDSDTWMEM